MGSKVDGFKPRERFLTFRQSLQGQILANGLKLRPQGLHLFIGMGFCDGLGALPFENLDNGSLRRPHDLGGAIGDQVFGAQNGVVFGNQPPVPR